MTRIAATLAAALIAVLLAPVPALADRATPQDRGDVSGLTGTDLGSGRVATLSSTGSGSGR